MSISETIFPVRPTSNFAKLALQYVVEMATYMTHRSAVQGTCDLANLDRRALADTGYSRLDWDGKDGHAIQHALVKINDW